MKYVKEAKIWKKCPQFFDSELNKLAAPPTTTKCWITAAAKLLLSHSTINFNSLNPNSSLLLYLKMERVNKRDVSCRVVVLFKFWLPFVWTYLNWTRFWFRGSGPMWSLYWSENMIRAFHLEITNKLLMAQTLKQSISTTYVNYEIKS